MIFPGRKPLMENISTQNIRIDDLLTEFSKQNFSGYAEFHFSAGKGIFLFHSGEIITAVYKEKEIIKAQEDGINAIKNRCRTEEGTISTYELPAELAHMLRGLCNREFVEEVHVAGTLKLLLYNLEESQHTGTLDLIFTDRKEKGMILTINGRISNTYLEMDKNLTLEGKEALRRIHELLDDVDGSCKIFKSDFSQEIWKSRKGTSKPHESRIYEILSDKEDSEPSPLQKLLSEFAEKINMPPFTALLQEDGAVLAEASVAENDGNIKGDFHKFMQEAVSLFKSIEIGDIKEILCTSEEKNLLIRTVSERGYLHVLILDRQNHPKDLRKQLASLDREIAALSSIE
jgi:hypothetical protein